MNNSISYKPILALYKVEFIELQTLFQISILIKAFIARDYYFKDVNIFIYNYNNKFKTKLYINSILVNLSNKYKIY